MGIYHIDASSKINESVTRKFSKLIVEKLLENKNQNVSYRDLGKAEGLRFVDETIVSALFISNEVRSDEQKKALIPSDLVIQEAVDNDTWVIGLPIYNFSVPATFKAWADMLARSGKTFSYTKNGPEGLLKNKKVFVVIASGGTTIDSEVDFCTPWLRHFLTFVGVSDLSIINADKYSTEKEELVMSTILKEVTKYEI
jgi:FMN-dependent NADH-azoreductase